MQLAALHNPAKQVRKKLIGRFGDISIYRVNGEQVRSISNGLEEFNESASHAIIDAIPENEGWVENTISKEELPFVVFGLVSGMLSGDYDAGELAEKAERSKVTPSQDNASGTPDPATYVRKLGDIFGIKFYLIDANVVRNQYKVDFALGGNNGPYDWVPRDEIWLDSAIHPSELPYIALHEFYERHRMLQNGLDYSKAHAAASTIEWRAREGKRLPQEHTKLMRFVRNAVRI
ncbi:MAG: hypothetical protein WC919_01440 [Candidatus Paceibacterota bacterium]|jgi:hypothetical protein